MNVIAVVPTRHQDGNLSNRLFKQLLWYQRSLLKWLMLRFILGRKRNGGPKSRRLSVRFPKAALYTVSTAAELIEHHRGRTRVHAVVPIEPSEGTDSAIDVVDTIIHDNDRVAIINSIFGHCLIASALYCATRRSGS
jgi:hypothetical protein